MIHAEIGNRLVIGSKRSTFPAPGLDRALRIRLHQAALRDLRGRNFVRRPQRRRPRPKTEHKVQFYARQFVDALAPSNFVATNPEVLQATIETGGENLLKGLKNLVQDLERGRGQLKARDLLALVYGWFTEGFDTLDLKEAKALLDELAS